MPESGTIRPTLTSAGCCARATVDSPMAAAPESTVRRVSAVFDVPLDAFSWFIFVLPIRWLIDRRLHAEIGPAHAVVRPQGLIVAFERDPAGFENGPVIGGLAGLLRALLDRPCPRVRWPPGSSQH